MAKKLGKGRTPKTSRHGRGLPQQPAGMPRGEHSAKAAADKDGDCYCGRCTNERLGL